MPDLKTAIHIAVEAHHGQERKNGHPYILHPIRVMLAMRTEEEMMAAILHDVVEDTGVTLADLKRARFPRGVLKAVDLLTKRPGQDYGAYLSALAKNPIARAVKIGDLRDNLNIAELPTLHPKDLKRLARYHEALRQLAG
ncbi:MAG TPA: HD domain-containing protein [Kiritimatiellia bacterium]|nr:HD domain-containing protein [Kiritimatiellia bacterium]